MDREALADWLRALDGLTYYAILGVPHDATADELKAAFHAFADTFHPDSHMGRPEDERNALGRIFRRGTEANRVLTDPMLRASYDTSLAEGATPAVASRKSSLPPSKEAPAGPKRLEDTLKNPSARPFARRAEELAKAGDVKQAKLQLTMARHYEPGNAALEEFGRELEARARGG